MNLTRGIQTPEFALDTTGVDLLYIQSMLTDRERNHLEPRRDALLAQLRTLRNLMRGTHPGGRPPT